MHFGMAEGHLSNIGMLERAGNPGVDNLPEFFKFYILIFVWLRAAGHVSKGGRVWGQMGDAWSSPVVGLCWVERAVGSGGQSAVWCFVWLWGSCLIIGCCCFPSG